MVAVVLFAIPATAFSHASLLGTAPANDQVVKSAPSDITLTFSEHISVAFGGVKVFGPDGARVDVRGVAVDNDRVAVRMPKRIARGTYAVSWRVISADGHPVRGAFVFHVGAKSGSAA